MLTILPGLKDGNDVSKHDLDVCITHIANTLDSGADNLFVVSIDRTFSMNAIPILQLMVAAAVRLFRIVPNLSRSHS